MTRTLPLDQADGLRRLFAPSHRCIVPVVSSPFVAFSGVMLERLTTAFGEHGCHTLLIDAAERASEPSEQAWFGLADCIEPLSDSVSYLAARGLALRHVDAAGSARRFLDAVTAAAPQCDVLLVHASAAELCRLFAPDRHAGASDAHAHAHAHSHAAAHAAAAAPCRPLLLADDHPASVTHAYAAMKLLSGRAGLFVHDLLLCAAAQSPRTERIAKQLATCADDFLGAALGDWAHVDPATDPTAPPSADVRRLVRERLRAGPGTPDGRGRPAAAAASVAIGAVR